MSGRKIARILAGIILIACVSSGSVRQQTAAPVAAQAVPQTAPQPVARQFAVPPNPSLAATIDAAQEVEYANGPAGTPMGKWRAAERG